MTAEILDGIPDSEYHSWPSLSSSGAKVLLREGGPEDYRWAQDHEREPTAAFDLGHVVHGLVLGVGAEPVEVMADSFRAKATSELAAKIREAGGIPLLTKDYARCRDMADAVAAHPDAAKLLAEGQPEQSITWTDEETGVPLRCRPDWLRPGICVDLKTTVDASYLGFRGSAAKFGYDLQAAMYSDGVAQATGKYCAFVFIAVRKTPPHQVAVYEPDHDFAAVGWKKYREAVALYAEYRETGIWPGLPTGIRPIGLPKYEINEWENR